MNRPLIAVDWGTTSLRGALLDGQGKVVAQHASPQGILAVPTGKFAAIFEANFEPFTRASGVFDDRAPCLTLISGMAGSQQGWVEAPYCPCPAGFDELAAKLKWLVPGQMAIVPGLSCEHSHTADVKNLHSIPDVMRGEEVQVFGALQKLGWQDATVVLPGTHSKWVTAQGQYITGFRTYMTGEVFALLRQHSLLARTLPSLAEGTPAEVFDAAAFDEGVAHALRSASLLATAFSTRTLSLFGRKAPMALASYLSGLVIGEELRAQSPAQGSSVIVVGSDTLCQRYTQALAQCGVTTHVMGAEATWHGLWALAQTL